MEMHACMRLEKFGDSLHLYAEGLPPDKIDLGEKKKLLDRSWEVLLAESVARLLETKPVRIDDEVRRALELAVA